MIRLRSDWIGPYIPYPGGRRRPAGWRTTLWILVVLLVAPSSRGQTIDEDQFKAAFLLNIASFVEWPEGSFKNSSDPIVSCIAGEDGLNEALEHATSAKVAGKRGHIVRRIPASGQLTGCHILFIGLAQAKRLRVALASSKNTAILTVGEGEDFVKDGGIIGLNRDDNHMRIQVNLEAADRNGLHLSSRLLALAQVVKAGTR